MPYQSPPQFEITLTRVIAASPADVYDRWLDAAKPGGPWFGTAKATVDPRVGGLFYHCVSHQGRDWAHYGRFVTLDRPQRIVHTWMSEGTRGLESTLTLDLAPRGTGTEVTLRHAGVPDDEFGHQHRDGWGWLLGSLEEAFAKRAT